MLGLSCLRSERGGRVRLRSEQQCAMMRVRDALLLLLLLLQVMMLRWHTVAGGGNSAEIDWMDDDRLAGPVFE